MIAGRADGLFRGLFDDASMFPPQDEPVRPAVHGHLAHRVAWYADMVGPFVCAAGRLTTVNELAAQCAVGRIDVAVVVPDGMEGLDRAMEWAAACPRVRVTAVEVPLGPHRVSQVLGRLTELLDGGRLVYLEIPVGTVDEHHVHDLAPTGVRLKLRTGGTSIEAFQSEEKLAIPILLCAAERLAFKCTAGLHNAVRHRDPATFFEHHGFINLALAARVAAATGSHAATTALLAERDPAVLAAQVWDLSNADVHAIRALFGSFGTCSISEPIADLLRLGLVAAP